MADRIYTQGEQLHALTISWIMGIPFAVALEEIGEIEGHSPEGWSLMAATIKANLIEAAGLGHLTVEELREP